MKNAQGRMLLRTDSLRSRQGPLMTDSMTMKSDGTPFLGRLGLTRSKRAFVSRSAASSRDCSRRSRRHRRRYERERVPGPPVRD
jgi:hypothetical protein